jgi:hypothetical protein
MMKKVQVCSLGQGNQSEQVVSVPLQFANLGHRTELSYKKKHVSGCYSIV